MNIIKVYGKARRANFEGQMIERQDAIFVKSENGWFRTIDTFDHFVYRRTRGVAGSTLMCTCGSPAAIFGFEAYGRFQSTNMGRIVCCISHMTTKLHADGSSG